MATAPGSSAPGNHTTSGAPSANGVMVGGGRRPTQRKANQQRCATPSRNGVSAHSLAGGYGGSIGKLSGGGVCGHVVVSTKEIAPSAHIPSKQSSPSGVRSTSVTQPRSRSACALARQGSAATVSATPRACSSTAAAQCVSGGEAAVFCGGGLSAGQHASRCSSASAACRTQRSGRETSGSPHSRRRAVATTPTSSMASGGNSRGASSGNRGMSCGPRPKAAAASSTRRRGTSPSALVANDSGEPRPELAAPRSAVVSVGSVFRSGRRLEGTVASIAGVPNGRDGVCSGLHRSASAGGGYANGRRCTSSGSLGKVVNSTSVTQRASPLVTPSTATTIGVQPAPETVETATIVGAVAPAQEGESVLALTASLATSTGTHMQPQESTTKQNLSPRILPLALPVESACPPTHATMLQPALPSETRSKWCRGLWEVYTIKCGWAPLAFALQEAVHESMADAAVERVEILVDMAARSWLRDPSAASEDDKRRCATYVCFPKERRMGKVGGEAPRPIRWCPAVEESFEGVASAAGEQRVEAGSVAPAASRVSPASALAPSPSASAFVATGPAIEQSGAQVRPVACYLGQFLDEAAAFEEKKVPLARSGAEETESDEETVEVTAVSNEEEVDPLMFTETPSNGFVIRDVMFERLQEGLTKRCVGHRYADTMEVVATCG